MLLNIVTENSQFKSEKELFQVYPLIEIIYGNPEALNEYNRKAIISKNVKETLQDKS